ncbi:MAG: CPBP family intramembrane metalloprotease [Clostridium sp.]|nr:CPBP family intramembrane metalloprotease [Clostridium sp.]MCM1460758.1 CPBP family intramembrane metalloprotease [Bacteroides sp.]
MDSNKDLKIKDIVFMFLPLIIMVVIQCAVNIFDVLIIFISNLFSDEKTVRVRTIETIMTEAYKQPMNIAYMTLARYLLYILVFGIWLYRISSSDERKSIVRRPTVPATALLVATGWCGQIFVDSILTLVRPYFPATFENYDKLTTNVTGAGSSWVLLLAVFVAAPIGEELLFRGLLQKYIKTFFGKVFTKGVAVFTVLTQALLFALYHGNVVQEIYAFVMGIFLGALAWRFGSLIPCILFHIAINASILLVPNVFFANKTATIVSGVSCLAVFSVFAVLIYRMNAVKHT